MMEYRPENPAKTYLKRYRAALYRQQSLMRSLAALHDRQTNCTVKLNAIQVSSRGFVRDRMAEEIVRAMELEDQIQEQERIAAAVLKEVLDAINAVPDEMQKTVLTLRYVEGLDWFKISEAINYEISNTYILHGRALWTVKKWLEGRHNDSNRDYIQRV